VKKGGPSADEVGLSFLKEMLGHSGRQRMRALDSPPEEPKEEPSKENEVDMEELARLIAAAKE
jgi:hypothetical protein